jgi:hypothetical protein
MASACSSGLSAFLHWLSIAEASFIDRQTPTSCIARSRMLAAAFRSLHLTGPLPDGLVEVTVPSLPLRFHLAAPVWPGPLPARRLGL